MRNSCALVCAAVLIGCGGSNATKIEGPPPPSGAAVPLPPAGGEDSKALGFKPGPGGFPVPSDADAGEAVGVDNTGYKIPRPKDAVYAQLRPELERLGFRIETYLPQPASHRMIMFKDTYKYIASVSDGDAPATSCTLFVTVSPAQ
jgi:hypothetical protein